MSSQELLDSSMSDERKPDLRRAFEHWYSDEGDYPKAVERSGDGYALLSADAAWTAWKAAWAACEEAQGAASHV